MDPRNTALVLTPSESDAEYATMFLRQSGIDGVAFNDVQRFAAAISEGAGCLVMIQEALTAEQIPFIAEALSRQPAWSDLPLIIIANDVGNCGSLIGRVFPMSGNVTLLERPLNPHSFVSAVQMGLRAAHRQHEVADLLAQREQALRSRDEFLAMLAHELRNPLAPMRNAVYLQRQVASDDPVFVKTRAVLDRQVRHMTRMVDDLTDVARLEHGKVTLQRKRVDLNDIVTAAVDSCMPAARAAGQRIDVALCATPLDVDADPVRLEQIITNLVHNATKFSREPGEIRVHCSAEAAEAVIVISDDGIGFEPAVAERLFELFSQGHQTIERSAGGLGIGLTIARRLAELHGGSIAAASEGLGKGAAFTVRLPLLPKTAKPAPPPQRQTAPLMSRRIVVVDDNADIRDTLLLMLSMWGHRVEVAADGASGLQLVLRDRPDVALIDIGLPVMNGYDVARCIRKSGLREGIRLIALTGYGQPSDREKAAAAGFDAHLLKPIAPAVLAEALNA
jgi:signal transduction histidine kinase